MLIPLRTDDEVSQLIWKYGIALAAAPALQRLKVEKLSIFRHGDISVVSGTNLEEGSGGCIPPPAIFNNILDEYNFS